MMNHQGRHETNRISLALYGGAIVVAVGAATLASVAALAPPPSEESLVVLSRPQAPRPDRLAGLIEPVVPKQADAAPAAPMAPANPAAAKPASATASVAGPVLRLAAIPPKPVPRPCLECTPRPAAPAGQAADADAPFLDTFDVASAAEDGPVPPMPIGIEAAKGEGDERGLLVRGGQAVASGGQAVVSGGSQLVGSAWNLSGRAVGGIVRGVRQLTF